MSASFVSLLVVFLLQDALQVLFSAILPAPNLVMGMAMTLQLRRRGSGMLWLGFLLGLLWDLRWSSVVGLSSLAWGSSIFLFLLLLEAIPAAREERLLAFLLGSSSLGAELLLRSALWWTLGGGLPGLGVLLVQLSLGILAFAGMVQLLREI